MGTVIESCGGGGFRQLIALTVQPTVADANAPAGKVQFSATGTYNEEPSTQANVNAQWETSQIAGGGQIASIDAGTGLAVCLTEGSTGVTATAAGKGGQVQGSATLNCHLVGHCVLSPGTTTYSGDCVTGTTLNQCFQASDTKNCPPGQSAKTPDTFFGCHPADFQVDDSSSCTP